MCAWLDAGSDLWKISSASLIVVIDNIVLTFSCSRFQHGHEPLVCKMPICEKKAKGRNFAQLKSAGMYVTAEILIWRRKKLVAVNFTCDCWLLWWILRFFGKLIHIWRRNWACSYETEAVLGWEAFYVVVAWLVLSSSDIWVV